MWKALQGEKRGMSKDEGEQSWGKVTSGEAGEVSRASSSQP